MALAGLAVLSMARVRVEGGSKDQNGIDAFTFDLRMWLQKALGLLL